MKRLAAGALAVLMFAAPALAATSVAEVEKKRDLVERLAKVRVQGDAAAKIAAMTADAGKLIAAGRTDQADAVLSDAIKLMSSQPAPKREVSIDELKARYVQLQNQLAQYRTGLDELVRQGGGRAAAGLDPQRIERLIAQAGAAARETRWDEAVKLLGEAAGVAEQAIAQARQGQTVVVSLKFETPADEYRYEVERHRSYRQLTAQALEDGRAEGTAADRVRQLLADANSQRAAAEKAGGAEDYPKAIKTMEQATRTLIAALQVLGLPVGE